MTDGERIKIWRESRGLSQSALAEMVGVRRQAVWNWENDKADPTQHNVKLCAERIGVSLPVFYGPTPRKRRAA